MVNLCYSLHLAQNITLVILSLQILIIQTITNIAIAFLCESREGLPRVFLFIHFLRALLVNFYQIIICWIWILQCTHGILIIDGLFRCFFNYIFEYILHSVGLKSLYVYFIPYHSSFIFLLFNRLKRQSVLFRHNTKLGLK